MWTHIVANTRAAWKKLNTDTDGGYASEAVLVTALLIVCALVVIGILVAKVTSKANDIDLGHPPSPSITMTRTWVP